MYPQDCIDIDVVLSFARSRTSCYVLSCSREFSVHLLRRNVSDMHAWVLDSIFHPTIALEIAKAFDFELNVIHSAYAFHAWKESPANVD